MALLYHPAALAMYRARYAPPRRRMGQLVEVSPEVKVEAPIQIELGTLPLSVGLFAGSALAFLVRSGLPKGWPQTVALVGGGALGAAGILNLVLPKAEATVPTRPSAAPSIVPPGGVPVVTRAYMPPSEDVFLAVTGRIASPSDLSTVNVGTGANSYPVRLQLQNPGSTPASFEALLVADENPSIGTETRSSLPVQVTVPPGNEILEVDLEMPLTSWGFYVDTVEVNLNLFKRRMPGSTPERLDSRKFLID